MAFGNALGDFEQKIVEPLAFGGRINLNKAHGVAGKRLRGRSLYGLALRGLFAVKTSASCREIIG